MSLRDEITKLINEKRANLESEDDRLEERFRLIKHQIADMLPALKEVSEAVEGDFIQFETIECCIGVDTIVVVVVAGDFRLKNSNFDGSDSEAFDTFLGLNFTSGRGGYWYFYPFFPPDGGEYWILETRALGYKNKKRFDTSTDLLVHLVPEIVDQVVRFQQAGFVFN